MAKQHLYSRVPAKISMFNRADSFDTFACSEELDQAYIDKHLGAVCENKPTADEAAFLRTRDLQPVYMQFVTKNGELVQSCTSYIRSDYTGERSAYMVHNLVYDEEEKKNILNTLGNQIFNPDLFEKDIDKFDITSPDATPDYEYPHLDYATVQAETPQWISETYDGNMLRRFIYAMMATACGKLKSVFFILGEGDTSERALRFINGMLQIMPYHFRPEFSFVTRLADSARFAGFKLKSVPASLTNIPPSRGATLDFKTKLFVGIKDEDVNANLVVVDFLYSLLLNDAVRREFLLCCDRAVQTVPSMGQLTFKALADLVFVFRSTSGMFDEKTILPNDDKMLEFFTIYEKARAALSDEYRINAAQSLRRYPLGHLEIPKALFAKIGKIYPTEIVATKRVMMKVVLDLIHTDIMRDKLFSFIKSNYAGEDAGTQATICQDLARVYYGGFLQPQILTFFGNVFEGMSEETRHVVVERVLLTVRTKAISGQVLQFLADKYPSLDEVNKAAMYKTILENLPDGDALAVDMIKLVGRFWEDEEESIKIDFVQKLFKAIENESRRSVHPMLKMLCENGGFFAPILQCKMFADWSGRKCFAEYVEYQIASRNQVQRVDWLVDVWQHNTLGKDNLASFASALEAAESEHRVRGDVFDLIGAEQTLMEGMQASGQEAAIEFGASYAQKRLQPTIAGALYEVFRHTQDADAVERAVAYIDAHPQLKNNRYDTLVAYLSLKQALVANKPAAAAVALADLPGEKMFRQQAGAMLAADLKRQEAAETGIIRMMQGYLRTGVFAWNDMYQASLEEADTLLSPKLNAKKALWFKQTYALQATLRVANEMFGVAPDGLRQEVTADNSGLREVLGAFLSTWDKKGEKELLAMFRTLPPKGNAFCLFCEQMLAGLRPSKKSKFGR